MNNENNKKKTMHLQQSPAGSMTRLNTIKEEIVRFISSIPPAEHQGYRLWKKAFLQSTNHGGR